MKKPFLLILLIIGITNTMTAQDEIKKNTREFLVENTKFLLKNGVYENEIFIRREFARIENDEFNFYVDKTYKSNAPNSQEIKTYEVQNDLYSGVSYEFFWRYIMISESSFELYKNSDLKKINFIFNITYPDNSSRIVTKGIYTPNGKIPLQYPFTKNEVLSVLR
ncbi:hypothetical protein [Tenacibaculum insulae]|uniref:hypothetical protein n=1 Tax=Tenacibaculum insulae TaxID=2029677 RepID=UPI003AB51961